MTEAARKRLRLRWWYPLAIALVLAVAVLLPEEILPVSGEAATSPVLVIDPGHGGADGGASGADGTLESDINLDIALRLEALARFWGVETVMTRRTKDIIYPPEAQTVAAMKRADQSARIALIHETEGAILVSIHQNYFPAEAPCGIQVFYGKADGSAALGELTQSLLTASLCPDNRRIAEPISEDIYLMKNADCTAILVECGFLSNPTELSLLKTEKYRLELAAILLASYNQYTRGYMA